MPPCTEDQRENTAEFLSAFDQYAETIVRRLAALPKIKRPPSIQRQIDQASDWRKLIKWMQDSNRKRKSVPPDLGTMGGRAQAEGSAA